MAFQPLFPPWYFSAWNTVHTSVPWCFLCLKLFPSRDLCGLIPFFHHVTLPMWYSLIPYIKSTLSKRQKYIMIYKNPCDRLNNTCIPSKSVHVLIPQNCEYSLIQQRTLSRYDQVKSFEIEILSQITQGAQCNHMASCKRDTWGVGFNQ